jgi:hypothetical protein
MASNQLANNEIVTTAITNNRNQPEDLDVTRNNEATTEFQAKTVELRAQRPQWITYYQLVCLI